MAFSLDSPHGLCVRGVDYNPNKPYVFVSCGDDCRTKYWDGRKLTTPLLTRQDHSHWYDILYYVCMYVCMYVFYDDVIGSGLCSIIYFMIN